MITRLLKCLNFAEFGGRYEGDSNAWIIIYITKPSFSLLYGEFFSHLQFTWAILFYLNAATHVKQMHPFYLIFSLSFKTKLEFIVLNT